MPKKAIAGNPANNEDYDFIRMGKHLDLLISKISSKRNKKKAGDGMNNATLSVWRTTFNVDGIKITIGGYAKAFMNVQARKLFTLYMLKLSREAAINTPYTIKITLKEFMKLCALKDRKNAMEQFREAAKTLRSIYMEFDYTIYEKPQNRKRAKKVEKHYDGYVFAGHTETRIFDENDIFEDGDIVFDVQTRILQYLFSRSLRPINLKIFTINPHQFPHAYNIAWKLIEHYNLNAKEPGQFVRLSVKCLIAACPDLPTEAEIKDRHYSRLIMEAIQRDLDALITPYSIVEYHYLHANREALNDNERYSYEEWREFFIEFRPLEYPVKAIEARQRTRKKTAKKV